MRRRPLTSFFVLTFLISPPLLLLPPLLGGVFDASRRFAALGEILVSWAPNLAALILVSHLQGNEGVKRLFGGFLRWKIPAREYAIALLVPFALAVVAIFAFASLTHASDARFGTISAAGLSIMVLNHLIRGPIGEEAGWRGFALPLLLERYGLFRGSLLLGGVWSFWHFPFWFMMVQSLFPGEPHRMLVLFVSLALVVPALSCVMSWLYVRTRSLVPVMLMHLSFNVSADLFEHDYDRRFAAIALAWIALVTIWGLTAHVWRMKGVFPDGKW